MQAGMGTAVVAFVRMKGKEPIVMMPTKGEGGDNDENGGGGGGGTDDSEP